MRGTGRYPPQPRFPPFAFYSAVRLGDPELLAKITAVDPYFVTQDNGAGAPLHFAVTYRQLDMAHHLLNNGALVNQADGRGWTPLHRAAHLAHLEGYMELYEYLLSRGADPSLLTIDTDPYLNPGRKGVLDVAVDDDNVRQALAALNAKYEGVPKAPAPHPDVGDWWALYDYGLEAVAAWPHDYQHPYPEVLKRSRDKAQARQARVARREAAEAALATLEASNLQQPFDPVALRSTTTPTEAPAGSSSTRPTAAAAALPAAAAAAAAAAAGPSLPVALLFPGQGSQALGMISATAAGQPAVARMLEEANTVLGYDLLALIRDGPKSKLDNTVYSQPALFVTNLAALELLRGREPELVERARVMAGLSLGEYCALVAAGAMSFSDGLKVVKARGAAMAAAAAVPPGGRSHGMLSVVGLGDADLERLCEEARQQLGGDTVCQLANYLFPQGRVVSGHADALDIVSASAAGLGALKVARLAVSGAFHTWLMAPARAALMEVLDSVEIRAPRVPVLSNVTAQPFPSDPAAIRELLGRQLVEPVRWEGTLAGLLSQGADVAAWGGCEQLYEVGPGQQVKAMVRRLDQAAWRAFKNVPAE
ncbi:hypothetical protein OEZ86_010517 [Tetradesmus obliquus]|nr:hypothetical protein OEZ86_010517 [Tetradesmus obliquus]